LQDHGGGGINTASGILGSATSVSGGFANTAGALLAVVIGGTGIINGNPFSIAPQPPFP